MTNQQISNQLRQQGFGVGLNRDSVKVYFNSRKVYRMEVEIALQNVPAEMIVQTGNSVTVYGIDS